MFSETSSANRRHQMYYEGFHTFGWVDVPDDKWSIRLAKGFLAGAIGYGTQFYFNTILTSYQHLRTVYHPPLSAGEFQGYFKGVFNQ